MTDASHPGSALYTAAALFCLGDARLTVKRVLCEPLKMKPLGDARLTVKRVLCEPLKMKPQPERREVWMIVFALPGPLPQLCQR